jgi:hypothetical protein
LGGAAVEPVLLVDQRTICKQYCKGWFAIDLLSCTPVAYIEMIARSTDKVDIDATSELKLFKVETRTVLSDCLGCLCWNFSQVVPILAHRCGIDFHAEIVSITRQVLRLLRLAKLLRLARIKRVLQRLEDEYKSLAQGSRIMKIIISILIVAHFVACAWYYAGSGDHQVIWRNLRPGLEL